MRGLAETTSESIHWNHSCPLRASIDAFLGIFIGASYKNGAYCEVILEEEGL